MLRTGEGHPGLKSSSLLASVRGWCTVPRHRACPWEMRAQGGDSWRNRCQPEEEAWIFPHSPPMCPSSFPTSLQILSVPDSPALEEPGPRHFPAPHIASICLPSNPTHPWPSVLFTFYTGRTWLGLSSIPFFPCSVS